MYADGLVHAFIGHGSQEQFLNRIGECAWYVIRNVDKNSLSSAQKVMKRLWRGGSEYPGKVSLDLESSP